MLAAARGWDEAAQAHATAGVSQRHQAAREGFFAGAALDPPGAAHFPWVDDPAAFVAAIGAFLS